MYVSNFIQGLEVYISNSIQDLETYISNSIHSQNMYLSISNWRFRNLFPTLIIQGLESYISNSILGQKAYSCISIPDLYLQLVSTGSAQNGINALNETLIAHIKYFTCIC